jgi:hypothetical protein
MEPLQPRRIRPLPDPLALYLRPGRNDHGPLLDLLGASSPRCLEGIVFDPSWGGRHSGLRTECQSLRVETVLDTKAMELATESGYQSLAGRLPWAGEGQNRPSDLRGIQGGQLVASLVDYVAANSFSALLAPAHLIDGPDDPWLEVDRELVFRLRERLDRQGLREVLLYYPLALRSAAFRDQDRRERLRQALEPLPIDAIWLRVQPFGSRSSGTTVRRYIEACRVLHTLQRPLVAERVGTVGLALLAFGAVGGIEHGVTMGEHFDASPLLRPRRPGGGFQRPPRVYLPDIGVMMERREAQRFFEHRGTKSHFGCRDTSCCRRGAQDMLADPRRHFLVRRLREVGALSALPESHRAQEYMDRTLRPATDRILRAIPITPGLETVRQRIEGWRSSLGALLESDSPASFSAVPTGRRVRLLRGA